MKICSSSFVVLLRQPMDRALPLPSRGLLALDFLGRIWLVQIRSSFWGAFAFVVLLVSIAILLGVVPLLFSPLVVVCFVGLSFGDGLHPFLL